MLRPCFATSELAISGVCWLPRFCSHPSFHLNLDRSDDRQQRYGRWVHFLSYAAIIVIPFAGCRKRKGVVLALLVMMGGIILQFLEMLIPGWLPRPQNIVANMFGVGAGILLGMNLRMMRSQAKPDRSLRINSPHSPRI